MLHLGYIQTLSYISYILRLLPPLFFSPQEVAHSAGPTQKSFNVLLLGVFFAFFGLPKRCSKNASKKHRKKCENRGFGLPKTLPKSAAPLSVPRRVRPMCFIYSFKYFALTTRGVRGTLTSQFSCFLARFLGPCWLYFSLLGASWAYLVLFWQSLLRCCSSRSNFWRLGTLRDRFWKGSGLVLKRFLVGFLG